ncbi:histidine phosphatase family protein [Hoeflea sp. CAU 1731]
MLNFTSPIYVIRHGETDWNAEVRFQGAKNIDLNAKGRIQARQYGEALSRLLGEEATDFDYISSPLARARETMALLRQAMRLPPDAYKIDERLIEISFGDWEGRTLSELEKNSSKKIAERAANKWSFLPPGENAESYEILSWRVAAWLQSLEKPVVCVCHGGVIRTLFHLIAGLDGDKAAEISTPQDQILKIEGDSMSWLAANADGV